MRAVTETEVVTALRRALAAHRSAPVRVRLASGITWARAVALAGGALELSLAGARIRVSLDALLEVGRDDRR